MSSGFGSARSMAEPAKRSELPPMPHVKLPAVVAVHRDKKHNFSKPSCESITLLAGLGVEGDAHCGETVQHRYDRRRDPTRPNLRQVHLFAAEFLAELTAHGFAVKPGDLGENITTQGIDLVALPTGTRLAIGDRALLEVTGLRMPCVYIERFQKGLQALMSERRPGAGLVRKAGVMGIVIEGGVVQPGDGIGILLPAGGHRPLVPV